MKEGESAVTAEDSVSVGRSREAKQAATSSRSISALLPLEEEVA